MGKHNCSPFCAYVLSYDRSRTHYVLFCQLSFQSMKLFIELLALGIMSSTNVTDKRQQREMHCRPALHPYLSWALFAHDILQHRSQAEEIKKLNSNWREEQSTICLQHVTHSVSLPPGQQCWGTMPQAVFNAFFTMLSINLFFFLNRLYWGDFFFFFN